MGGRGGSSGKGKGGGGGGGSSGGDVGSKIASDLNGKRWVSPDGSKERIYLNDTDTLASTIGLKYTTYKSGAIKSATLNGEKISNSKANDIFSNLQGAYYDVKTGTLHTNSGALDRAFKSKYK